MSLNFYLKHENGESESISFERFVELQSIDLVKGFWGNKLIRDVIFARENAGIRKDLLLQFLSVNVDPAAKISGTNYLHHYMIYVKPHDTDVVQIVQILLDAGVSAEEADYIGWTPLVFAVARQHVGLVSFLIEKGANVNFQVPGANKTPLIMAAEKKNDQIMHILLDNGANVHSKTTNGWTALHQVCFDDNFLMIVELIARGADVDATDGSGMPSIAVWNHYSKSDVVTRSLKAIIEEVAKKKFANLESCGETSLIISGYEPYKNYYDVCMQELQLMKKTIILKNLTLYSVLKKKLRQLSFLTKNEEFVENFRRKIVAFKIYQTELKRKIDSAFQLQVEIQIIDKKLKSIFQSTFPFVVLRKIEQNLSTSDIN